MANVGNYEIAIYSKNYGNQGFKRNYNLFCVICKIKGHSKKNHFKVVGYTADYKQKKKKKVERGK